MQIQINTDRNIEGGSDLRQQVEGNLNSRLERFSEQVTRLEVHLSDQNSDQKSGENDKRCLLEARVAGLQPITVNESASTVKQAVDGAVVKLVRSLDSMLGKLGRR